MFFWILVAIYNFFFGMAVLSVDGFLPMVSALFLMVEGF
jgi:hypothetical protein